MIWRDKKNKNHYISNEDNSILSSELASVVSSGLTITDGILVILQDGEDKNKAALLEKILRSIETGSSISRAWRVKLQRPCPLS